VIIHTVPNTTPIAAVIIINPTIPTIIIIKIKIILITTKTSINLNRNITVIITTIKIIVIKININIWMTKITEPESVESVKEIIYKTVARKNNNPIKKKKKKDSLIKF
jgi:hypothetical protein